MNESKSNIEIASIGADFAERTQILDIAHVKWRWFGWLHHPVVPFWWVSLVTKREILKEGI